MGAISIEIKEFELKKQNILRIDFDADKHYFVLNTDRADFCLNGQRIIANSHDFLWTNDFRKISPQKKAWAAGHKNMKSQRGFYIVPERFGELSADYFKVCDQVSEEDFMVEVKRRKVK